MGHTFTLRNKRYKQFATIFLFLLWGYLSFHLFVSERSVTSYMMLSAQEQSLDAQLDSLRAEKAVIQGRVVRLRPQTLDGDLLEEQSMIMLGRAKGNAVIVLDHNG